MSYYAVDLTGATLTATDIAIEGSTAVESELRIEFGYFL